MTPMVKRRPFKPPKESTIAYIGLGANLGEREKTIEEALRRIEADDRTSLLRSTVPIETDPVSPTCFQCFPRSVEVYTPSPP